MDTFVDLLRLPSVEREYDPAKATLLIVPGYCHYANGADDYTKPENWFLNKFQKQDPQGELSYILNMIRLSIYQMAADPNLVVAYTGGFTSKEAGEDSSEAGSYLRVARQMLDNPAERLPKIDLGRVVLGESSYNSNHNVLDGLTACKVLPAKVRFFAYSMKVPRLELVARELGLKEGRFECQVVRGPIFTQEDFERERKIVDEMKDDILLLNPDSRHAQLTRARNWSNKPVHLLTPESIREYYAELDRQEGLLTWSLPRPVRRSHQVAAD